MLHLFRSDERSAMTRSHDLDAVGDDPGADLTDGPPDEPVIDPLVITDGYSGVVATITYADGAGQLELVKDDGENYQRLRVDITEKHLLEITRRFGLPLGRYQEEYENWRERDYAVRDEVKRRELASRPFAWVEGASTGKRFLGLHVAGTAHRAGCRVVKGQSGNHYGELADIVTKSLGHLRDTLDPAKMQQRKSYNAGHSRGHVQHTLKLCGTCKPIGEQSGPISQHLDTVANTVTQDAVLLAVSKARVDELKADILAGLMETAQEHAAGLPTD